MKRQVHLLLGFLCMAIGLQAQVTTNPSFPVDDDNPITITYNAAQGTAGLLNCNCTIYAHTGVITNNSTSPSDWKYVVAAWGTADPDVQMTSLGNNLHSITFPNGIRSYYGVPEGEEIQKMAFVFRNAAGTLEGKATGGLDIFVDVFPGNVLSTQFIQPILGSFLAQQGQNIPVQAESNEAADLALYQNGTLVASASNATVLNHTLTAGGVGTYNVMFVADNGSSSDSSFFSYTVAGPVQTQALPANSKLGITYLSNSSVRLVLFAPNKQNVFVQGSFNGYEFDSDYQMKRHTDGSTWWLDITGLTPGQKYSFQYVVDGTLRVADPLSEVVLDPFNDGFIPASTYPNLPQHPGAGLGIVTLLEPGATPYNWQDDNFQRPAKGDLVVYELLIRDFMEAQNYQGLIDTLDYLERLGVTAIQLMPIQEFEGNISWGYNPSFHMALDKYYGTRNDFKAFVDACHDRGIAVIVDVVYNHAFSQSPLCQLYWDAPNQQPAPGNPWVNVQATHPFNVGYDLNHESQATREYIKRVMRYWIDEFHIDGFRFDLSKGFTQTFNPDNVGAWSAYDQSRVNILNDYANTCWSEGGSNFYVILEHLGENSEESVLSNSGMMLWGKMTDPYNEATMGYTANSNLYGTYHGSKGWNDFNLVSYMESHDEERLMYKNLNFGNQVAGYNTRDLGTALDRVEAATVMFYTIPGSKMLWQFGELGYDFSINYCPNGTISSNCRTDPKPIRWDYYEDQNRRDLYNVTADMIYIKTNFPTFKTSDVGFDVGPAIKRVHLTHPDMNVLAMANFGMNQGSVQPFFQNTGWWYEYFSGDSVNITNTTANISLQAGEYRLYTSKRVERPSAENEVVVSSENPAAAVSALALFPNPSSGQLSVQFEMASRGDVAVRLLDLSGRQVATLYDGSEPAGPFQREFTLDVPNGLYFVQVMANGAMRTQKLNVLR